MITPAGSSVFPTASGSAVGLEAQLERCRKQLSDSVNCTSSKTPEGKARIEELSNRISEIKTRIEKSAAEKQQIQPGANIPSSLPNPLTTVGLRLDVYA